MKLFDKFKTFDGSSTKQSTYFVTICRNRILDLMKPLMAQRSSLTKTTTNIDLEIFTDWNIENENDNNIMSEIKEYIAVHKHKDVLEQILGGLTQTEVARIKGVSKQYINKIYNDFVREMKKELIREENE